MVLANRLALCFNWQVPKGCRSTNHLDHHICSGCRRGDHGAHAIEWRRCEPLTPYNRSVWAEQLSSFDLQKNYPHLIQGLAEGFDLGIPLIQCTYAPPNHSSINSLLDVYSNIVDNEFSTGCYIRPFSCTELELILGSFQTSPLSLVPKTLKPGKY